MIDIVFPTGNESDFIRTAEKLGFNHLIFSYNSVENFFNNSETKIKISNALFCSPSQIQKMKKTGKFMICKAEENSREILEHFKPNLIFAIEEVQKKDQLHHRTSGVNQVLCKIAEKNNVIFGFSFSSFLNKNSFVKSQIMGRMMQNISLFKKYKNDFFIASFAQNPWQMKSPNDLSSFFQCLGMHQSEIKTGFKLILERFENKS